MLRLFARDGPVEPAAVSPPGPVDTIDHATAVARRVRSAWPGHAADVTTGLTL